MKIPFLTPLAIFLASSLSLAAAPQIKLELITPKEPLVIPKALLEESQQAHAAYEAYQAEARERKLDEPSRKRLEQMAWVADRIEQGIELRYRLTNTGTEDISVEQEGDVSTKALTIKGPGVHIISMNTRMTDEMRRGKLTTIEPGKSVEFGIKELRCGSREMQRWLITQAGEYEASLNLWIMVREKSHELKAPTVKFKVVSGQNQ